MRLTGVALLMATALSGAACYTMRPVTLEQLRAARPGAVWITREDQSVVVVETPRMFGDTLVGYVNGEFEELPATDLKQMRVRRMAGGKTTGLVAASAAGAFTFVYLVTGKGSYFNPEVLLDCDDDPDQRGCPGYVGP